MQNKQKQLIMRTLEKYCEKAKEEGHQIIYIGVHGSHNYNLNTEDSKLNARGIVVPTIKELIFNKACNKVLTFEEGELEIIDLISYYQFSQRGVPSYLEVIQSEYYIGNEEIRTILDNNINLRDCYKKLKEYEEQLQKPTAENKEIVEMWGFDPKIFSHLTRGYTLIYKHLVEDYKKSFYSYDGKSRQNLLQLKYDGKAVENFVASLKLTETPVEMAEVMLNSLSNMLKNYKFKANNNSTLMCNFIEENIIKNLKTEGGQIL